MSESRYRFALATASDDADLRERMRRDWMRGSISVSFRREPSYFLGCGVQGEGTQVIQCRDTGTGQLMGMGSRTSRCCFVNGVIARMGHLADLRAAPEARSGTLLARGYRFLRTLHEVSPLPLYTTVIFDGNEQARRSIASGRAGLPAYRDQGLLLTPAIHLDFGKRALHCPGLTFQPAEPRHTAAIAAFLNQQRKHRQFAPVAGQLHGEFLLAIRQSRIVACASVWDQSSFRQVHLEEYSPQLRRMRPFYNALTRVTPLKRLPDPGARVNCFYLSSLAVEDDDVEVAAALVREVYRQRRRGKWSYFIAGMHERDPLVELLGSYRHIAAAGRLFVVHYEDGSGAFSQLDARVPHIEVSTL